jgi:phosphoribosylformimino-5-aminoimidazole carboxamide ribotide isomerase
MRIIPAIDILNGKCVRLTKGDFSTQKIYNENPLEVAKEFEANGIKYLHLVDLDGAKSGKIINHKVLREIATQTQLKVDFGGGIKSRKEVEFAFEQGASQVTCGSMAIKNPEIFNECFIEFGAEKIILGADCNSRKIVTNAWLEKSEIDVLDFIQLNKIKGLKYVICTDISKDGMLEGPAFELYQELINKTQINLIASGGISNIDNLIKLKELKCEGAIIGKAIYENKIKLVDLKKLC